MSDLRDTIKLIQGEAGVERDGIFGPVTAAAVLAALRAETEDFKTQDARLEGAVFDDRTERALATLDAKAVPVFRQFLCRAQATAATLGFAVKAISGTRSMEEQRKLYEAYQAGGPKAAPPGSSWHNYGIALDLGVFNGGIYVDETHPAKALQVYRAIKIHATVCGLEWGGEWKGRSCDPPHWQIDMGSSSPTAAHKRIFKEEGSVL